jgi:hypothetical protein
MMLLACGAWAAPQDEEAGGRPRRIWNKRFQEARANRKRAEARPQTPQPHLPKPPKNTPRQKNNNSDGELIGVTLWRLQPASEAADATQPRMTVTKSDGLAESFFAERVGANQSFREGELVRMGVEVARESDGYLYVVNREVYADGRLSEPYLIFPSSTTPPNGNVVTAGRIVYLPADGDKLPYFTIQRSQIDRAQVGEKLTLVVSRTPLRPRGKVIKVDDRTEITQLDAAQVAEWERAWGGAVEQYETKGKAAQAWTLAEKRAGEGEGLGEDDPLPQTIYRVKPKPGAPAVAHVFVRVAP